MSSGKECCMFGTDCYMKNPNHFMKYRHPHLETDENTGGISQSLFKLQRRVILDLEGEGSNEKPAAKKPKLEEKSKNHTKSPKPSKPLEERVEKKEAKTSQESNDRKAYKNNVRQKLANAAPLYLFYNKIKDGPKEANGNFSLYFADLLHPSLGNIKSTLQITFMVELDWLMMNYEMSRNETKPLTILCGDMGSFEDEEGCDLTEKYPNIEYRKVKPRYPYGTHHTKIMVIIYDDDSVRVVVLTSNLLGDDWINRTQGLWVSPKCPKLFGSKDGESTTKFKKCLLEYLHHYELPTLLRPYITAIINCDMSEINAFFIGSVPGSHLITKNHEKNYGQSALNTILKEHVDKATYDWDVFMQCSSIGSLGSKFAGSFMEELAKSLNGCQEIGNKPAKNIKFVYPTINSVINALGGPAYGGGCLPYSEAVHRKQTWLENYLYKWKSDSIFRTRAMPHVKSFTKIDPKGNKLAYFVMTSCNLSKAAWGKLNKDEDKVFIMSYEAGILLLPQFTHGKAHYKVGEDIVLPFDVPAVKYDLKTDTPFYH